MPKVVFLIPASPTRGFLSQIAAFDLALSRLNWSRWEREVFVCTGGEGEAGAVDTWRRYLRNVAVLSVPPSRSQEIAFYYAQIDGLFRWAPIDADVYVRADADTLPVGDLEEVIDHVADTGSVAGVMAHYTFPVWPGMSSRQAWLQVADGLISKPLDFRYSYSLTDSNARRDDRIAPFYLNDGVVFFPRAIFREFAERFLYLRPQLMDRCPYPYFAGQIALSLALAEMEASTCALPMRYNFPNDEAAAKRFPEELEDVRIFHYLRTDQFDRQLIFTDADNYELFSSAALTGTNLIFRDRIRKLFGPAYPFGSAGTVEPLEGNGGER